MARHTRLHWAPAAAILILCAAFAWFSPAVRGTCCHSPLRGGMCAP